jgi:tRNA(Leu) C34 or U34 (ribose-2'-O)-methylase TrmL
MRQAFPAPWSGPGFAAIGLHHPKNTHNVGGVLRAAYAFGAAMIAITGTRYHTQRTDTTSAYRHLPLLQVDNLHAVIPYDCIPVAIELRAGATALPDYDHPQRAFYIFGPEDGDLGPSILQWCRDLVYIPTRHSLNLAAAVNIVLYDRLAKHSAPPDLPAAP